MLCNRPLGGGAPVASGGGGGGGGGGEAAGGDRSGPGPYRAGIMQESINPRGYDPALFERLVIGLRV